jgi:hypothetical protein
MEAEAHSWQVMEEEAQSWQVMEAACADLQNAYKPAAEAQEVPLMNLEDLVAETD